VRLRWRSTTHAYRKSHTALEERFRRHQVPRHITIPYDQRLRTMLDSGTYACERLDRATRLAVKRLGLAVVAQLV
jgi:hypothetical protein